MDAKETNQTCAECGKPTGRCGDDSLYRNYHGPFCFQCFSRGAGAIGMPSGPSLPNFTRKGMRWDNVEQGLE